ncbi:MAG: hypothetical protein FJX77_05670 [Armatimonadetes bacterium]|nr:hypothetical protein [Armatimonadota bacterium]
MGQASTLAWLVDEIERKFGQGTQELHASLFMDINRAVDRLTRRHKFWFLNVEPDTTLQFPITSFPSATVYSRHGGTWTARGWLITTTGRWDYPYLIPDAVSIADADPLVTDPERWHFAEISALNFVHFYDKDGVFRSEIQIVPETEWWRRANLKTSGLPAWACFKTEADGVSHILLAPKPNDIYLFQVGARLATLPPLDRPLSTHAMLAYYPHVVLQVGLCEAAKYFRDQSAWMLYMAELYGMGFMQKDDPNFIPGGMIGEMLADSRNRSDTRYLTAKTYTSSALAIGRNGPRRSMRGRYYVTGSGL